MVNKIDKEEFHFIEVAFFMKTNLRHVSTIDIDGKDSLKHLRDIIESTKPMIKTLCLVHDEVERSYRNVTNVMTNNKRVLEFHFIWARMILEFYYFYYDSKEEAQKIVDEMLSFEGFTYVKETVQEGIKLINNYYESEWKETMPDTPRTQKPQSAVAHETDPQQSADSPCPDILQTMEDINSGRIHPNQVNWESQIKEVLRLCTYMSHNYPRILWLWYFINYIDEPTKRMDVLCKIRDAAPKCFDNASDVRDFQEDCQSLYHICNMVRGCKLSNKVKVEHVWTDEDRKTLNDLALILNDDCVDAQFLVALAEDIYSTSHKGEYPSMLVSVLRCSHHIGHISFNNIIDFSKMLYSAEGYRQCILSGNHDYMEMPNIDKFKRKIRNACFDVYIELRAAQIKQELENDNGRVDDPDEIEYYYELARRETEAANREISFEQFRGSRAYNALWYEGRGDVLKMTDMFIQYLPIYIAKKQSELSSQAVNTLQLPANANQVIIQTKEVKIKDNNGTIISDSDVSVYPK